MELKVWVDGIQRIVCGVTQATTCQDVVFALAHATSTTGRFTLIERWRSNERLLAPSQHPLKVLLKWGEHVSDVQFILQRTSLNYRNEHNLDNKAGDRGEHGAQELQIDPSAGQQRNMAVAAHNRNNICNNNVQSEGLSPLSSAGGAGSGGRDIRKSLTFSGAMVSREGGGPGRGVPPYDPAKVEHSSTGLPDVSNGVRFGAPTRSHAVCVSPAASCVDTNPALNSSAVTEMSPLSSSISPRSHEHPSHQRALSPPAMPLVSASGNASWRLQQSPHNGSPMPNTQQSIFQNAPTMHDRHSPLKTPPILPPPGVRPAAPPPYELVRGYPPSPPYHGGSVRRRGYRQSPAKGVSHNHTRQHSSPASTSSDRVGVSQASPLRFFNADTRYSPQGVSQGYHDVHATRTRNTPPRSQQAHFNSHETYSNSSPHQTQAQYNKDYFQPPSYSNTPPDTGVRPSSANSPNKYDLHQSYESPYGYTARGSPSNQGISPQAAGGSFYQCRLDSHSVVSNSYVDNRVSSSTANTFPLAPPSFSVDHYNHSRRSAFHAVPNKSDGFTPPRMLPPYRPPPPPPAATKSYHMTSPGASGSLEGKRAPCLDKVLKCTSSPGEVSSPSIVPPSYARENNSGSNYSPNTNNKNNNNETLPSSRSNRESGLAFDHSADGDCAPGVYIKNVASTAPTSSSVRSHLLPIRDQVSSIEVSNNANHQIKKHTTDNSEVCNGLDNVPLSNNSAKDSSSNMPLNADKNDELCHGKNGFLMVSSKSVINSSSSSVVSLPKCNTTSSSNVSNSNSDSTVKGKFPTYGIEAHNPEKQSISASLNSSQEWASYPNTNETVKKNSYCEAPLKYSTSSSEDNVQQPETALSDGVDSADEVAPDGQTSSQDKKKLGLENSAGDLRNEVTKVQNSGSNTGTPVDGSQESHDSSTQLQEAITLEEDGVEMVRSREGGMLQDSSTAVLGRQVEHVVLDNIHQDLVTLVNKQRDQLTGQQILLTKFEAEITYLEGRWREDQAKLSYANAEMERLSLLLQKLDDELGGRDPSVEEEELKSVLGTKEQLSREMSAVHQQIQQCDAQIEHLTNSVTSLEDELLALRLQGEEQQQQDAMQELESCDEEAVDVSAQPPSPELAKMLVEVESALAGKREQVEELKRAMMTENLEALSLTPPDRLAAAPHTPAGGAPAAGAGGSGRRMLGPPRMLETAVPTSKNPHGVWV